MCSPNTEENNATYFNQEKNILMKFNLWKIVTQKAIVCDI